MKTGLVGLILLILAAGCGGESVDTLSRIQEKKIFRVGTDATYPPFETFDPRTSELVGFDVDLIRAIADRMGARVEFQVVPFDGILAALRAEKFDAVISALTITPERAEKVLFSEPYHAAGQSICVPVGSLIAGADDLEGKRLGVQLGTTGEIAARRIESAKAISFDAIGAALLDLRNGNVDAVIVDTPTGALYSREHPEIRLVGEPITEESYGIAFRLTDRTLKEAVDEELAGLERDGTIAALRLRWSLEVR